MIYFDFDGVIRNLVSTIPGTNFTDWDTPIEGKSFIEYFNNNLNLLIEAPPTEYYSIINNYSKDITIMTCQAESWKSSYEEWISIYFSNRKDIKTIFVDNIQDKIQLLQKEDFLIDDYPKFNDYSQVILIKRIYNRNVKDAFLEISRPEQLQRFLELGV